MNSKNDYNTFLNKEEEQPRLAILQRFKDINRVMTDNYLRKKNVTMSFKKPQVIREYITPGEEKEKERYQN